MIYTMTIRGNHDGIYTDPNTYKTPVTVETLEKALNWNDVTDLNDINHFLIYRFKDKSFIICYLCGFTPEKGIIEKEVPNMREYLAKLK